MSESYGLECSAPRGPGTVALRQLQLVVLAADGTGVVYEHRRIVHA